MRTWTSPPAPSPAERGTGLASVQRCAASVSPFPRFEKKQTSQRTTVVAGATDRKTLIALLRRNANLIKEMRVQLKLYQSLPTKHEVWERFQGYTKLIILGGGDGIDNAEAKS